MNHHPPHILSVGQCQFDGPWMKRVLEQQLGAVVESADCGVMQSIRLGNIITN